jgi:microcompartment protein CcmL/EutN
VAREALGLVETRGYVAAVEAADAMCKTARVRLVRCEVTRDGLVTMVVRGAVAEVEAAVEAARGRAARLGDVAAVHVIPAPEPQLEQPMGGPARGPSDSTP